MFLKQKKSANALHVVFDVLFFIGQYVKSNL